MSPPVFLGKNARRGGNDGDLHFLIMKKMIPGPFGAPGLIVSGDHEGGGKIRFSQPGMEKRHFLVGAVKRLITPENGLGGNLSEFKDRLAQPAFGVDAIPIESLDQGNFGK